MMKKIIFIILLAYSYLANGQTAQYANASVTNRIGIPLRDTTGSVMYPGRELRIRPADSSLYKHNGRTAGQQWNRILTDIDLLAAGMSNPMTTPGDIIVGGAAGVPTRKALGSALQILRVNSGATGLEFVDPPATVPSLTSTYIAVGDVSNLLSGSFAFAKSGVNVYNVGSGAKYIANINGGVGGFQIEENGSVLTSFDVNYASGASRWYNSALYFPTIYSDGALAAAWDADQILTLEAGLRINQISSTISQFRHGALEMQNITSGLTYLLTNGYMSGGNPKYRTTGTGSLFVPGPDVFGTTLYPSGSADATMSGNTVSFAVDRVNNGARVSASSGNVYFSLGVTGIGASATGFRWNPTTSTLQLQNNTTDGWLDIPTSAASGEANTASNLGGGLANYSTKVGVDLRFNSFNGTDFDLASNLLSLDATLKSNYTAAYNDRIVSAAFTGTTTKTLTLNQQDGGTITANFTDNNDGGGGGVTESEVAQQITDSLNANILILDNSNIGDTLMRKINDSTVQWKGAVEGDNVIIQTDDSTITFNSSPLVFSQIANGVHQNTTTEGSGLGTLAGANSVNGTRITAGSVIKMRGAGTIQTGSGGRDITIQFKFSNLQVGPVITGLAASSTIPFSYDVMIVPRAVGTNQSTVITYNIIYGGIPLTGTSTTTMTTTGTLTADLRIDWSAADASNIFTSTVNTLEVIRIY